MICVRVNWNTWASGVSRALINWETLSRNPALLPSPSSCADRVVQRGCSNRLKRLTTCVYIQRWEDPLYILPLAHTDLLLWARVSIIRVLCFRASGKTFLRVAQYKTILFSFLKFFLLPLSWHKSYKDSTLSSQRKKWQHLLFLTARIGLLYSHSQYHRWPYRVLDFENGGLCLHSRTVNVDFL